MGGDVAPAHPAADLVELGEPERVGALDDQRVRLRDVEARLDDRRRDEHVGVAGEEREHPLLELALRHLAVGDEEAQLRAELPRAARPLPRSSRRGCAGRRTGPRARARARARAWTSSSSYSPTCVRIGRRPSGGVSMTLMSRSPASDMCSVRGIGVADSESTSTSRRSWRSSSFCATPKRCSSSTITSPRFFGDDVAREHAVRADEDVDLPRGEVREHPLHVGGLAEAGDHLDVDRQVAVALAERVPVLLGEDRRRREHERLAAVRDRDERGAHGDLGLAEADVAADEPVHRPRRLEILLDGLDRAAAGRASPRRGSSPRAARRARRRPRTRRPRRAGAARRARAARRPARARPSRARFLIVCQALPPSFESAGACPSAPT